MTIQDKLAVLPGLRILHADSALLMAEPEGVAATSKLDIARPNSVVWIGAGTVLNHCNITAHGRNNEDAPTV
jgi:hypothetical protein